MAVFGYLILISIDFYDFPVVLCFTLVLVLTEKIYQSLIIKPKSQFLSKIPPLHIILLTLLSVFRNAPGFFCSSEGTGHCFTNIEETQTLHKC